MNIESVIISATSNEFTVFLRIRYTTSDIAEEIRRMQNPMTSLMSHCKAVSMLLVILHKALINDYRPRFGACVLRLIEFRDIDRDGIGVQKNSHTKINSAMR